MSSYNRKTTFRPHAPPLILVPVLVCIRHFTLDFPSLTRLHFQPNFSDFEPPLAISAATPSGIITLEGFTIVCVLRGIGGVWPTCIIASEGFTSDVAIISSNAKRA